MPVTKVDIDISDNGSLAKLNAQGKEFNKTMKSAAAALKDAAVTSSRVPASVTAAKRGVAARSASAARSVNVEDADDSNIARGIGGLTGAAGRDFAAQARGLGGLVHVYATFAANIFALTAAFGALSKAADTTNMIKGLDQLGAASGRGLGSLAKRLTEVTDGAISLKGAMEAVAQASAGGMGSANILRMGNVAKQASQALGRDMSDALSRLSRGITKLEPELLDELGIMVRVDRASEEYARTLGKGVSQLTDFEKRQGFANAVLTQAEQKFGAISLVANPYQKILASTQNLLQSGLELVNKFLGPLLDALSKSPAALGAALAAITTILLKQAMPAVAQWREAMEKAGTTARQTLIEANKARQDKILESDLALYAKQEQAISGTTNALAKLNLVKKTSKTTKLIEDIDPTKGVSQELISSLEKQALARGRLKILENDASARSVAAAKNAQIEAAAIRELVTALQQQATADANVNKLNKSPTRFDRFSEKYGYDAARNRIADAASAKAVQERLLGSVAKNLPVAGIRDSFVSLFGAIKNATQGLDENGQKFKDGEKNMTKFGAASTAVRGSLAILTSGVTTLAMSLGNVFAVVGVITTALYMLNSFLSENSKEAEETSKALETLNESALSVDRTLEALSKKDPLGRISVESINARSTALNELTNSLTNSFEKLDMQNKMAGWWDTFIDGWKAVVGADLLTKASKEAALGISKIFEAAVPGPETNQALKEITRLLGGIDPRNVKEVQKYLSSSPEIILSVWPKVNKIGEELNRTMGNMASKGVALQEAFRDAGKTFDEILISAVPTDPLAKLGSQSITIGKTMADAFEDPINALREIASISKDITKLRLVTPETAAGIIKQSDAINRAASAAQAYSQRLDELQKELEDMQSKRDAIDETFKKRNASGAKKLIQQEYLIAGAGDKQLANKQSDVALIARLKEQALATIEPMLKNLDKVQGEIFAKGAELIGTSIGQGFAKAALTIQGALSSGLGDTEAGIKDKARIQKEELSIQMAQLRTQESLIVANERLRLAVEENSIEQAKALLATKTKDVTPAEFARLFAKEAANLATREAAVRISKEKFSSANIGAGAFKELSTLLSSNNEEERLAGKGSQGFVTSIYATKAQQAGVSAQIKGIDIAAEFALMDKRASKAKETLANTEKEVQAEKTKLDLYTQGLPYLNQETLLKKQALDETLAENKAQQIRLSLLNEYLKSAKVLDTPGASTEQRKFALDAIIETTEKIAQFERAESAAKGARDLSNTMSTIDNLRKINEAELALNKTVNDTKIARENSLLSVREENINKLNTLGIDPVSIAQETAILNIDKERVRHITEIGKINQEERAKQIAFDTERAKIKPGDEGKEARKELKNREAISKSFYAGAIDNENKLTKAKLEGTEVLGKHNVLLAEQAEQMKEMVSLTESLSVVFGDVGNALGKFGEALTTFSQAQTLNAEKIAILEKDRLAAIEEGAKASNTSDQEAAYAKEVIATKNLDKAKKKSAKDELTNMANVMGTAKKMFKEKTAGYKALDAIEKAIHAYKMVMMVREQALEIQTMIKSVAASMTKAAVSAKEGTVKAVAETPGPIWVKLAAGAAAVAFFASLLGGKGPKAATVGATAEDRQSVQGTGLRWEDDKKVETGGGVFGDSEAKSESIKKSIDIIKDNSIEGLAYDNRMLKALESINSGINNTAKSLYGIVGLRSGSITGTPDLTVKTSGITGLFGKTTSKEIIDSGLLISGTFTQLAKSADGLIKAYETIRTTTKSSGFLGIGSSTKTTDSTTYLEVKDTVEKEISAIFSSAEKMFITVGQKAGIAASTVMGTLEKIDVSSMFASLRGLKGEDLEKEFSAVISNMLDNTANTLFSSMTQYRKFGEGMLETVIRVVDGSDKVKVALNSIGVVTSKVADVFTNKTGFFYKFIDQFATVSTKADIFNFDVTEALISAAGDIENFTSQITYFSDNFLTEAEKIAPVTKNVTDTLSRLGIVGLDTREEFAQLIRGLDLTNATARDTYQSLMDIAPAFTRVYTETRKVADSLENLISKGVDLQDQYDKLTMSEAQYTAKITAGYGEKEIAQFNANKALEAEIARINERTKLSEAFNNLEVGLLKALGKEEESVQLAREMELSKLAPTNQAIQRLIYSRQDEITSLTERAKLSDSFNNLEVDLLKAQGKDIEALALTREIELSKIEPVNQALQQAIYARQDEVAAITERNNLSKVELESATKYLSTVDRITTERNKERDSIKDVNKPLFDLITNLKLADSALITAKDAFINAFDTIKQKADSAKADLLSVAQQGLSVVEEKSTQLKDKLQSLAVQGLDLLRSKLADLQSSLANLATSGVATLRSQRESAVANSTSIQDSLVNGYKSALEAQQSAVEAYNQAVISDSQAAADAAASAAMDLANNNIEARNAMRGFSKSIKEFLKELYKGDDSLMDEATKLKALKGEFSATVSLARGGDKEALAKLPDISKQLLDVAKSQSSTKLEYARTYGQVTGELSSISQGIDDKLGTVEEEALKNVTALSNSSSAAAAALDTANTMLARWTESLKSSGLDVQKIIDDEKAAASPEGLQAKFSEAKLLIGSLDGDIAKWLAMLSPELRALIPEDAPETLTKLETAYNDIKNKIATSEADIVDYINLFNPMLEAAGFSSDQLLSSDNPILTVEAVKSSIGVTKGLLSESDKAILDYISLANILLTNAGFGTGDLLKPSNSPITIDNITEKLQTTKKAYDDAIAEVNSWETAMTSIGIAFTPWGEIGKDNTLQTMLTGVQTAKAAFDSSNSAVTDYLSNIANMINSVTMPVLPSIPTTPALPSIESLLPESSISTAISTPVTYNPPVTETAAEASLPTNTILPIDNISTALSSANDDLFTDQWHTFRQNILSGDSSQDEESKLAAYKRSVGLLDSWVPKYATGGSFKGGLRIVGETGPELESTGPSRIYSNSQTKDLFNNEELIAEIRALRQEVAQLKYSQQQTETHTRKTKDLLVRVSRDGDSLLTAAA